MINWKEFELEGVRYDLSHLHPYKVNFEQPAKDGKPAKNYEVAIEFSMHCFTRGHKSGEDDLLSGPLAYADSRETRIFDFRRYECSKKLREIIEQLPKTPCYHTNHGTFFTIRMVDDSGKQEPYEVYFTALLPKNKPLQLKIYVQSAYIKDGYRDPKGKKKVGFFVILNNTLQRKAIKAP